MRALLPAIILTILSTVSVGAAHAADPEKGGKLYAANCAMCHGAKGVPLLPGAPNFTRHDALLKPDFTLMQSIRNGKNAMPGFLGILSDRDIYDVIAYLRTLH